jgi:hypothetical protein
MTERKDGISRPEEQIILNGKVSNHFPEQDQ